MSHIAPSYFFVNGSNLSVLNYLFQGFSKKEKKKKKESETKEYLILQITWWFHCKDLNDIVNLSVEKSCLRFNLCSM